MNWQVIIIYCGAKLRLVPETLTIGQLLDGVANCSNLATSRMLKHTVKRGSRQKRKENATVTLRKKHASNSGTNIYHKPYNVTVIITP